MARIFDGNKKKEFFYCFKTALEQLQTEKLKCEILKP